MTSHRLDEQTQPVLFIEQLTTQEWLPLLASYQLLPNVLREILLDRAIADWEQPSAPLAPKEITTADQAVRPQHPLTSTQMKQAWLKHHSLHPQYLEQLATRKLKIQKFKQAKWGAKLVDFGVNPPTLD